MPVRRRLQTLRADVEGVSELGGLRWSRLRQARAEAARAQFAREGLQAGDGRHDRAHRAGGQQRDERQEDHQADHGDPDRAVAQLRSLVAPCGLLGPLTLAEALEVGTDGVEAHPPIPGGLHRARSVGSRPRPAHDALQVDLRVLRELTPHALDERALTRLVRHGRQTRAGARELAPRPLVGLEEGLVAGQDEPANAVLQVQGKALEPGREHDRIGRRARPRRRVALIQERAQQHAEREQRDEGHERSRRQYARTQAPGSSHRATLGVR